MATQNQAPVCTPETCGLLSEAEGYDACNPAQAARCKHLLEIRKLQDRLRKAGIEPCVLADLVFMEVEARIESLVDHLVPTLVQVVLSNALISSRVHTS